MEMADPAVGIGEDCSILFFSEVGDCAVVECDNYFARVDVFGFSRGCVVSKIYALPV
jgi:hypothetical protein